MRPRIAINQAPSGGSIYPFAVDSFLAPLVLDFYMVYEDDQCVFAAPFRLKWLSGFGTNPVSAIGGPTPTNDYDVQILDANDNVVFDSTETTNFNSIAWGSDRLVLEWIKDQDIVRMVVYSDAEVTDEYDSEILTDDGELDPRTYRRIPKHVHAIRVGVTLLQGNVQIKAGYNVDITADTSPDLLSVNQEGDLNTGIADGGAFVNVLNLDGVPGAGLGRIEGCVEGFSPVRTINQIKPDDAGNFIIEADDCFRLQLPVAVSEQPSGFRTAEYAATGYTQDEARSGLKLYDDCTPCCDCHFFARTYIGLRRVWGLWEGTATEAERVRDVYSENRDRWLAQLQCRIENPLKLIVLAEPKCRLFEGGLYCNVSKACLRNVEARYTMRVFRDGAELTGGSRPSINVIEAYIEASSTDGEEAYNPLVSGSVVEFFADYVNPQQTYASKARICYSCQDGDVVEVTLTIHAADPVAPPELAEPVVLPEIEVPAGLAAAWADSGVGSGAPVRAMLTKVAVMTSTPPTFDCPC